jgi:ribose 5-phosphate isomerase A
MKPLTQPQLKAKIAQVALSYIGDHTLIGVGSGSTMRHFIHGLSRFKHQLEGCVASSVETAMTLREIGIPVLDLTEIESLSLYIDSADEVSSNCMMIKGGGAALTREKIIATAASEFICIVDESKWVAQLGKFPIAVEVLPLARGLVGREILKLGGKPFYREQCVTDNGNIILDVFGLDLVNPIAVEEEINQIPGVVENGLFAKRKADRVLIACQNEVVMLPSSANALHPSPFLSQ